MSKPLLIARTLDTELFLLPGMANRHGLITGATGTGKTVTLQKLGGISVRNRRSGVYGRCKR